MPRFDERPLRWIDVIDRFESQSAGLRLRDARGVIERIKDEGTKFFGKNSEELDKWQKECSVLLNFLDDLWQRRDSEKQNLETAMREFIGAFEHSEGRMEQMLYKFSTDLNDSESVRRTVSLIDVAYRASTYALLSAWIPDKHDDVSSLVTVVDLSTSKITQKGKRKEMRVPKKYKRNTKRF